MLARTTKLSLIAAIAGAMHLVPGPAMAEEARAPGISIELSAGEDVGSACRLSFLITNGHPAGIAQAVYEVVLFGPNGGVAQMTLLDFRDLPAGRPRVRQFQFDKLACADIPRILINGAETCAGAPDGGCIDNLLVSTRTGTELIG